MFFFWVGPKCKRTNLLAAFFFFGGPKCKRTNSLADWPRSQNVKSSALEAALGPTLMRLLHGGREVFRHNACLILGCFGKVGMRYIDEIAELSGGPLPSCEQPRNWPDGGRCARRPRPNPLRPHWQPPCFCKADAGLAQEAIAMIRGNPSRISRALRGWEQEATEFTQVVQGLQ